jgi:hypothetical protein
MFLVRVFAKIRVACSENATFDGDKLSVCRSPPLSRVHKSLLWDRKPSGYHERKTDCLFRNPSFHVLKENNGKPYVVQRFTIQKVYTELTECLSEDTRRLLVLSSSYAQPRHRLPRLAIPAAQPTNILSLGLYFMLPLKKYTK